MSILAIKQKRCGERPVWQQEYLLCYAAIQARLDELGVDFADYSHLFSELDRQNHAQWDVENAVRLALKQLPEMNRPVEQLNQIVNLAQQSANGNERRAALVRQIDELFGAIPDLKSYA